MVVLLSEIYLRVYLGIGELYFLGDSKLIRDIPKIIKLKATTSLRISCLFCIFKHSPKKRFDGQNGGN